MLFELRKAHELMDPPFAEPQFKAQEKAMNIFDYFVFIFCQIACTSPGPGVWLDYGYSDLWAVGALAYEIFGGENPFYRNKSGRRLDSRTYREEDLPPLPGTSH